MLQISLAAALAAANPQAETPPAPPTEAAPQPPVPAPASSAPDKPAQPDPQTIVVTGRGAPPGDPAAAVNEVSFQAVQAVDDAVVAPIAMGYAKAAPKPVRQGIHNALNNLSEPINFANALLQFKIGKAFRALGRFGINSTIGVVGLVDVARRKPFNLRYERNGFANTLGFYGIGAGPYMYLPLIGPTSARDLVGRVLDLSLVPGVAGKPFSSPAYAVGTGVARSLDDRVELDDFLRRLKSECTNPYAAERDYYLAVREAEIASLRKRPFDLDSRLPACLAEGPRVRVGQAVPPPPEAPAAPAQDPAVTPQM
ncbi:MAG: VacJ family lipoprotein [Novosphingobium sp.]